MTGARESFFEENRRTLESAYLASDDPRAQSGFRGDAARWARARRVIVEAIDSDGTFLDIGCANGLLMESVAAWALEKGVRIEPYGLDFSAALVELAKHRLPHWADRIHLGNAFDWTPPMRFRFVRTELVYVPERDRRSFIERLVRDFLEPRGRLIVAAYGGRNAAPEEPAALLRGWDLSVAGGAEASDSDGTLLTRVAWVAAAIPRPESHGHAARRAV
jgi:trans-aconitate methyltransferase